MPISEAFYCLTSPLQNEKTESTVTNRKLDSQANQTDLPQTVGQRISSILLIRSVRKQQRRIAFVLVDMHNVLSEGA